MNDRPPILPLESGAHAKHCIERRGKRRLVKNLLRERLTVRRFWARFMALVAAAGTLATMVSLALYGAQA